MATGKTTVRMETDSFICVSENDKPLQSMRLKEEIQGHTKVHKKSRSNELNRLDGQYRTRICDLLRVREAR